LLKQQEKLEQLQLNARRDEARKFAKKLEEKEKILEEVLNNLKSNPSKRLVARSWEDIKFVKKDAVNEAERIPGMIHKKQISDIQTFRNQLVPLSDLTEMPQLEEGQTIIICKEGSLLGKEGKIVRVAKNRLNIDVNGMEITLKYTELALPQLSQTTKSSGKEIGKEKSNEHKLSKMARKALAEEGEDLHSSRALKEESPDTKESANMIRLDSNTIDVLGCNFEEAKRKCEDRFSKVMFQKRPVVYILHGHGTQGVLKEKIRSWLQRDRQWVKSWKAADRESGGDAPKTGFALANWLYETQLIPHRRSL